MFNMVVFGPPGCGKGTQSKKIIEEFGYRHMSSGDLIRKEIRKGTAMGQFLEKFISRGLLVPDGIIMKEIFRYWLRNLDTKGMVFDGFPRNLYQAQMMDRVFNKKGYDIELVISIEVPEDELIRRVIERGKDSGRADDNAEVMHNRLLVYQSQTRPVIEYYKKNKRLFAVDGQNPIEEVYAEIRQLIVDKNH
ncbi:MAG: adenylate kinase [Marinilabiliales bacterium]|nr:MAG: adenylate kinase [Marinilabiliales bacterium]